MNLSEPDPATLDLKLSRRNLVSVIQQKQTRTLAINFNGQAVLRQYNTDTKLLYSCKWRQLMLQACFDLYQLLLGNYNKMTHNIRTFCHRNFSLEKIYFSNKIINSTAHSKHNSSKQDEGTQGRVKLSSRLNNC